MPDNPDDAPPFIKEAPLGSWVEQMITLVAGMLRDPNREAELAAFREDWEMVLAPDIPAAWIYWTDRQGRRRCDNYLPAQGDFSQDLRPKLPPGAPRRTVTIPFALIETAADLLVDTLARQQSDLLPSEPPTPRAAPDAKTPAPRHREPASTRTQPSERRHGVSDTHSPEPRMPLSRLQALACGTAGQPPDNPELTYARVHSFDGLAA
jgi:hypothetical protein